MRAKAGGGRNSFGGVNADGANTTAAATDSPPTDNIAAEPFTVDELEVCFDNRANEAKAECTTLDELVKKHYGAHRHEQQIRGGEKNNGEGKIQPSSMK